ncbi:hypothetical protein NHX12_024871 [Muraenolepis orangiensis]|uniref:Uncharacterized protein n=1 Tax=Muraenolepis orangiensis TaxID=630683 RepID=A0A9Q0ELU9_9TELE|nr:hypothetical protein NHX12_024871 [Muraenolepis orangiensis]
MTSLWGAGAPQVKKPHEMRLQDDRGRLMFPRRRMNSDEQKYFEQVSRLTGVARRSPFALPPQPPYSS